MTGRGLDLLRVSPCDRSILGQTEIGAGGIDVVSEGAILGRPVRGGGDLRGEPLADAVLRLDASGAITKRIVPTRQLHANGVAAADGQLWLFDAVAGLLVRLPA